MNATPPALLIVPAASRVKAGVLAANAPRLNHGAGPKFSPLTVCGPVARSTHTFAMAPEKSTMSAGPGKKFALPVPALRIQFAGVFQSLIGVPEPPTQE